MIRIEFERTAPPRATRVRIIRVPDGEAPVEIRNSWVGLELPLHLPGTYRRNGPGFLSAPRTWIIEWIRLRLGSANHQAHYVVAANAAVEELSRKAPRAAQWFRENKPEDLAPGRLFLFPVEDCYALECE